MQQCGSVRAYDRAALPHGKDNGPCISQSVLSVLVRPCDATSAKGCLQYCCYATPWIACSTLQTLPFSAHGPGKLVAQSLPCVVCCLVAPAIPLAHQG